MRRWWILCFVLFSSVGLSFASNYPKVKSYDLDVEFFPAKSSLDGLASVVFENPSGITDDVVFYLHGELRVDSIKQDGAPVEFSQSKEFYDFEYSMVGNKTVLPKTQKISSSPLEIFYHGHMHASSVASPSDYMRIDPTGVYLRSYGYSLWFPVFLPPSVDGYRIDFNRVVLKTPPEFKTVFIGQHLGDSLVDGRMNSNWASPDTRIFDAQCTSQKFLVKSEGGVTAYYWNDSLSIAAADKIIGFSSRLIDEYKARYNSSANMRHIFIAEMPKYGDISNGNMVGISGDSWTNFENEEYARRTLAHELVHTFVRIELKKTDPLFALEIEGFPSYFHLPVLGEIIGGQWYNKRMANIEKGYLQYRETGKDWRGRRLPLEIPLDQITESNLGDYKDHFVLSDRALLFLNYLRRKMGEETFGKFCHDLFTKGIRSGAGIKETIVQYLPGSEKDIDLWLSTSEFPERFRITK